jgi:hypothetical protein
MSEIQVNTINEYTGANGVTIDGVNIKDGKVGGGYTITEADQWRLTVSITNTNADITSNLERIDTPPQGVLGTGMTESSGVFTFPSTGIWQVTVNAQIDASDNDNALLVYTYGTTDNFSSEVIMANVRESNRGSSAGGSASGASQTFIDVTDTSLVKVKFATVSFGDDDSLIGSSTQNETTFTFIRLGDT